MTDRLGCFKVRPFTQMEDVMARKGDEATGLILVVVIVLAPFIWLYNAVGAFWFWVIVLGLPILALIGWVQKDDKTKATKEKLPPSGSKIIAQQIDDPWLEHCMRIEQAWDRGDYDWARQQLQQIAYGMVGKSVTDEQRKDFTRLMTQFASEDPLYHQVMAKVLPMVRANPGMKQSDIYKGQPDPIKEQMRYVLYFANELGHIHRIKKGNSYKLTLPGDVIEGEAVDTSAK